MNPCLVARASKSEKLLFCRHFPRNLEIFLLYGLSLHRNNELSSVFDCRRKLLISINMLHNREYHFWHDDQLLWPVLVNPPLPLTFFTLSSSLGNGNCKMLYYRTVLCAKRKTKMERLSTVV